MISYMILAPMPSYSKVKLCIAVNLLRAFVQLGEEPIKYL